MIDRGGKSWARPSESARLLGLRGAYVVTYWVRAGHFQPDEVRRQGRYLLVDQDAAQRIERATRGVGRPRAA